MQRPFMIYGATGYTGKLMTRMARERGLDPILAGRSARKLESMAAATGLRTRSVGVDDRAALDRALRDIAVVINLAGPFSATAGPVADACLRTRTHYLDVGGEIAVFQDLYGLDARARERGVMIMPGVGLVVVATDCLAAHAARRLPGARRLRLALSRTDYLSRGSARTVVELISDRVTVRRDGVLAEVPVDSLERAFDFGEGDSVSTAASWPDVFTAFLTTGIPDVEGYLEVNALERGAFQLARHFAWSLRLAPWQAILGFGTDMLPEGPSYAQQATHRRAVVAEVEDDARRRALCRLRTPEAYWFTALAALTIVDEIARGNFAPGFRTPAGVYGPDFVLGLDGVEREDLPS